MSGGSRGRGARPHLNQPEPHRTRGLCRDRGGLSGGRFPIPPTILRSMRPRAHGGADKGQGPLQAVSPRAPGNTPVPTHPTIPQRNRSPTKRPYRTYVWEGGLPFVGRHTTRGERRAPSGTRVPKGSAVPLFGGAVRGPLQRGSPCRAREILVPRRVPPWRALPLLLRGTSGSYSEFPRMHRQDIAGRPHSLLRGTCGRSPPYAPGVNRGADCAARPMAGRQPATCAHGTMVWTRAAAGLMASHATSKAEVAPVNTDRAPCPSVTGRQA